MRGNELLDKLERIDPTYIEAADTAPNKRKSVWAKWGTLAACLCLVCVLAVPAMAAFSPAFYELLYAVTPPRPSSSSRCSGPARTTASAWR